MAALFSGEQGGRWLVVAHLFPRLFLLPNGCAHFIFLDGVVLAGQLGNLYSAPGPGLQGPGSNLL